MGSKRSPAKPDTFANGPVWLDRWIGSQKQVLRCRNLQVLAQTDSQVILLSLDGDQWRFLADWKIWTVVLICLTLLSLLLVSFKEWYSENCSIFSSWDCRTSYNPFWEAGGFRASIFLISSYLLRQTYKTVSVTQTKAAWIPGILCSGQSHRKTWVLSERSRLRLEYIP